MITPIDYDNLDIGRGPHIIDRRTGRPQTGNTYLGSRPEDTYCGPSIARSIPTDAFIRRENRTGEDGGEFRNTMIFEYSQPGWDLQEPGGGIPVKVTYEGYNAILTGYDPHNFLVEINYFDYRAPTEQIWDRIFGLPLLPSFDANALDGKCDASAVTNPAQQRAVLNLPVRDRLTCDTSVDPKDHPLPTLPDQYEVRTSVNFVQSGLGNNFTEYRHQWFDGQKQRAATTVYSPNYQHRIELGGDVGVQVYYDKNGLCVAEPIGELVAGSGPHIVDRRTGQPQTSNTYIGNKPEDTYCGTGEARGIPTDAFLRYDYRNTSDGSELRANVMFEYSQDGWKMGQPSVGPIAPVRVTYEGTNSIGFKAHTFKVVEDYFDFKVPADIDRPFQVPMPMSFDAKNLKGRCNASALTTPKQRNAVLGLNVRNRIICDADGSDAKAHPLPTLPDQYEVRSEVNYVESALGKNFSQYRHTYWDGVNQREATTVFSPVFEHRIELGDVGLAVTWDRFGYCAAEVIDYDNLGIGKGPHIINRRTGQPQTSNTYLGSLPDDQYCTSTETRGIATDVFSRFENRTGADGGEFRNTITFEYSQTGWDLAGPSPSVPVRVSYEGYNALLAGYEPHNFRVVTDYFQFTEPEDSFFFDIAFQLPMTISFDPNNLDGYCNGTALIKEEHRAAILALGVRPAPGSTTTTSSKKTQKKLDVTLTIIIAAAALVFGCLVSVLSHMLLGKCRGDTGSGEVEITAPKTSTNAPNGAGWA